MGWGSCWLGRSVPWRRETVKVVMKVEAPPSLLGNTRDVPECHGVDILVQLGMASTWIAVLIAQTFLVVNIYLSKKKPFLPQPAF